MLMQLPSRYQRSNGIPVLEICLVLAVFFWMIYQVKHSHDIMDVNEAEKSLTVTSTGKILKYGRKEFLRLHVDVEEETGGGIKEVKDNKIDVEEKQEMDEDEDTEDKIIDTEIDSENQLVDEVDEENMKHEDDIKDKEENPSDDTSVLEEENPNDDTSGLEEGNPNETSVLEEENPNETSVLEEEKNGFSLNSTANLYNREKQQ